MGCVLYVTDGFVFVSDMLFSFMAVIHSISWAVILGIFVVH